MSELQVRDLNGLESLSLSKSQIPNNILFEYERPITTEVIRALD